LSSQALAFLIREFRASLRSRVFQKPKARKHKTNVSTSKHIIIGWVRNGKLPIKGFRLAGRLPRLTYSSGFPICATPSIALEGRSPTLSPSIFCLSTNFNSWTRVREQKVRICLRGTSSMRPESHSLRIPPVDELGRPLSCRPNGLSLD